MVSFIELNNESCQVIVDVAFLWFAYYGVICFTLQCCHYFKKNINELEIFKAEKISEEESDSESEEEPEEQQPIINEEPEIIEETDSEEEQSESVSEQEQTEFIEVTDSEQNTCSDSDEIDPNYTYPFLKNYSLRKRRRTTG